MHTFFEPFEHQGTRPAGALPPGDTSDHIDPVKYLNALRRRWLLLVSTLLIAVIYALVQYSLTPKQYKSTATIQIERKRLSLVALGQAGWLEDWWNMEYYPTQYRLLRSRGMAERVVTNLDLHKDSDFTGRPASLAPQGDGTAEVEQTSEAQLAEFAERIRGRLVVNPIKETQLVELTFSSTSPERAAEIANGYARAFIEWGIETRNTTVGQASSFLTEQINTLHGEIEDRQQSLNSYTTSSNISLDPDGQALLERRQSLEEQYNTVVAERIRKDAAHSEILSMGPETVANSASGGRVSELKAELFLLEGDYRSKLGTYTPEWPEMVRLKEDIDEKRGQLDRMVQESFKDAKDRASAELQKARREEKSLEQELERLASDFRLQNSAALEYINQKTYIETRKELLAELVKRQSETEVASRTQNTHESNVRIVDQAIVPTGPYQPSLQLGLTQAVLLGLVFGVGLIFLLEYLDRTVKTPEELEGILGLPTLALIPDLEEKSGGYGRRLRYGKGGSYAYGYGYGYGYAEASKPRSSRFKAGAKLLSDGRSETERQIELLPHHSPRLVVSEAYRSLRTALLLSSAEELKVVALTSAEPGEGKTATTSNLAVVLAQLGRKVLVIDADLRRPRMHKVFKVSNRLGLVNALTSNVDLGQLFQDTGIPNLRVCPSGPHPPNPSELLASDRMRELLTVVRSRFDFVLLDTPPTLPVADAIILGPLTDGLVLCARAGALLREDAKECRERLRLSEIKIFGTVLNRYSTGPNRYNKRYRYYGAYEEPEVAEAHTAA